MVDPGPNPDRVMVLSRPVPNLLKAQKAIIFKEHFFCGLTTYRCRDGRFVVRSHDQCAGTSFSS